jgi:alanyl-tRNA synthetase
MKSKVWTSSEIRQSFLDFFKSKGHTVVNSASLVPKDDPTLLFTNAGMNQFKDVFLGLGTRPYTRATDTQKCMRVSGKHNDLDDVGRDTYHHTFFEMLGNWSFGDYYKKEAIAWAWELLTDVWGLPKEHLWATCFEDDKGDLGRDEEAAALWQSETDIATDHILYFGRKDNFWEMGDTGPCGPCSEIHLDRGPSFCDKQDDPDHVCAVNGDCARYLELWNLVFIQYLNKGDYVLEPLPDRHIDTGAGFARLVSVLQGKPSNYQTDLFVPIMDRVQEMLGHSDAQREDNLVGYRVIADHARAVTFLIGDGVLPANEGRGYVLRMILRRAVRFGRAIGFTDPFMDEVARVVIRMMSPVFPELEKRREFILTTITQEELRFLRTLDMGLGRLDEVLKEVKARGDTVIPGEDAFRLYDTFGLPIEITRDVVEEHGFSIDVVGYQEALEAQRARARAADVSETVDEESTRAYLELLESLQQRGLLGPSGVEHDPYTTTTLETEMVDLLSEGKSVTRAQPGDMVEIVLKKTCFYFEAGGQVADTGVIAAYPEDKDQPVWEVEVTDVRQPLPGLIVHVGKVVAGHPAVGDVVWARVDYERRMDIARNHTATHLLQSELRYILGEHVQQAGSLVSPERLRFDFTHPGMLTQDELEVITRSVNDAILANYPVQHEYKTYRQALDEGVIALFGEKYGDVVRVLRIGMPDEPFSKELCGGTHVSDTAEIGYFHIISEQGIGAGVRRIEAVTGHAAVAWVERHLSTLEATAAQLLCPPDGVERKVLDLVGELHDARKEIARLQQQLARTDFEQLLDGIQNVEDVPLLVARVDAPDRDTLLTMTDWFRDRLGTGVILLGAAIGGRPSLVAAVTEDLVKRGIDAQSLVRAVAKVFGGGGGGRPTLAQAGGKNLHKLDEALKQAPALLKDMLAG